MELLSPGAEVELYSNESRQVLRTNEIGAYHATLDAGTYWIGVKSDGFCSVRRARFQVQPSEVVVFNFQLEVCPSHGRVFEWRTFEVAAPPGEVLIVSGEDGAQSRDGWREYKGFLSCDIATGSREIPKCELNRRAVQITFDRMTIRADRARFNETTQQLEASGNVLFEDYDKRQRLKRLRLKFTPEGVGRELE